MRPIFCAIELGAGDLLSNWSNLFNHPILLTKGPGVRLETLLDASVFMPWRSRSKRHAKGVDPKDAGIGFIYRRRPSVFPSVRLSFSASGISATIGVYGAKAPVRNSWENSWGNSRSRVSNGAAPRAEPGTGTQAPPSLMVEGAIEDRNTAAPTSAGLGELRALINEAARKRQELKDRIGRAKSKLKSLEFRLTLARFPILALFLFWAVDELRQAIANARAEVDAASDELQLCIVDLTFDLSEPAEAAYAALKLSFDHLSGCSRIWGVASSAIADRPKERTTDASHISRHPVRVGRSTSAIFNSTQEALRFDTANGAPLLIYPGVAMMPEASGNIAFVDIRELNLKNASIWFIEEADVPSDTNVVGKTWKRVNLDGSRDHRFQNNYQIPVVQYGSVEFSSQAGIGGAYHFSDTEKAALFAADFEAFRRSLSIGADSSTITPKAPEEPAVKPAEASIWPEIPKKPTRLRMIADMCLALAGIALAIYFGLWSTPQSVAVGELGPPGDTDPAIAGPANAELVGVAQSDAPASAPIPDKGSRNASEDAAPKYVATVKLKRANVRADPRKSAAIVATLKKGKTVMLLEQRGDWYRVQWGHEVGWMHKSTINLPDIPSLPGSQ